MKNPGPLLFERLLVGRSQRRMPIQRTVDGTDNSENDEERARESHDNLKE
jgi:hypothetical protein